MFPVRSSLIFPFLDLMFLFLGILPICPPLSRRILRTYQVIPARVPDTIRNFPKIGEDPTHLGNALVFLLSNSWAFCSRFAGIGVLATNAPPCTPCVTRLCLLLLKDLHRVEPTCLCVWRAWRFYQAFRGASQEDVRR